MRLAPYGVLALAMLSCGRDVAQTAYRDAEATEEIETSCQSPLSELPAAPPWVSGKVEDSPLVATSYGAGEGPGLFISARDAYRIYVNGVLIRESTTPRSGDFVPLSLLPGDTEIAVAVWAARGTPTALLQLDELTQSYVSDDSWSVEVNPGPGFASLSYDDGAATAATEHGRLGALPGCDPLLLFPETSLARWIGPSAGSGSSAVMRKTIRIAPLGFGEKARGGGDAAPVLATTYAELEALAAEANGPTVILLPEGDYDFRRKGDEITLRAACPSTCSDDAEKQQFRLLTSGETCATEQVMLPLEERTLHLGSNKTLVGLGRGAHLRGVSVDIGSQQNLILRNIAVYDVNRGVQEAGDAFSFQGARDVWLDHVTAKWISDGFTDLSAGTRNITLSWLHYDGRSPEACRGRHTHVASITDTTVTLHHTFFDHADSHAPLVNDSESRAHVLNDLVEENAGYGVAAACGAQILLEGTTFRNVMTPTARRDCGDGMPPLGAISAKAGSNLLLDDVGSHAGGDGTEPHDRVFEPAYTYTVEPAAEAGPRVRDRAGVGGIWRRPLELAP